ncbi:general substrate transporter [Hortaea werneckii]|nr:general substrate transporter [Hortaea werneckii]KAI6907997.1 general substrate transporter [Hortaea werneckii]KAI6925014.1 general substrate transporter [Hortaea werneckii]KAI6958625.1 general substrate transporter [Hortaea werneckii]KAI7061458.1 general substrate transporter [Hortaea werneckii]
MNEPKQSENIAPTANGREPKPTVCVFCGSQPGTSPAHLAAARALAHALHANNISLVYGGGTVGIMGEVAKTLVSLSGPEAVHGVIPEALIRYERNYNEDGSTNAVVDPQKVIDEKTYGRTTVVKDMHTRKQMMAREVIEGGVGGGFIALSGGYGTLEELMEVVTWNQLGIHGMPVVVYNVEGYWDGLMQWVRKAVSAGFVGEGNKGIMVEAREAEDVVAALKSYQNAEGRFKLDWGAKASESALTTAKIPSLNFTGSGSTRRPANIPLHTLERRQRRSSSRDGSWDEKGSEDRRRLRGRSSASEDEDDSDVGSEFSLWSDTGDLVDQLADEEDPLAGHFKADDNYQVKRGRSSQKRQKAVRYASNGSQEKPYTGRNKTTGSTQRPGVVKKEDIYIPSPPSRPLSWGQKFLATIMAPNDGPSRMHGLHGKKLLYFLSIFVSLGVFLFGYDQGVMSGIITGPYFKDYFNQPSRAEIGTMVAILEIGALISSLSVGRIGDVLGRRKTILYGAMVFVVGGACQTFSTGMPMMMLGRFVAGLGVGALSTIVPVYQSEISPPHNRGKLACIEFSGNIFGYMCSVWVDYFCSYIPSDWAWRVPLLLQVVMGGLLAVGSFLIVESPRWLLDNDHDEEGIVVIANLYGKGDIHNPKARDEYREIKMNVLLQRQEGERSYADMFKRYYKRVFIAMSAQALAQLNGINVISYYAPLVFEQAGWVGRDAILMTGINGITYLASTVPPWYVVDRLGRRFILLSGAIAMIISLSAISYFIFIDIHITPTMVVIFVMIYNAAFGYSWGPIPWLYPPEILPLSIRAKGASLSTAANWAFNWLVGEMTPILQEAIKWRLYLVHAFFCAVSFVVVWFIYPETANVRLEDMNSLFGDATTAAPTPQTLAEAESLFSGNRSPIGSFSLGSQQGDGNVPDMDLQPPDVEIQDGKPMVGGKAGDSDSQREGVGGWISSMVKRGKGEEGSGAGSGKYKRLGQDEDEEHR